ncbi:MAG: MFS transporter [Chloroflexi bacterium]|nr:MFS transporter [Chloroflexota bacterium]
MEPVSKRERIIAGDDVAEIASDGAIAASAKGRGFRIETFRSLRHRDFRLLWFGTLFSSSGQWLQQVTLSWLTYQITGSPFLLGAINGFRSFPLLLLGPFGGVAADRFNRKGLMLATQIGLLILTASFATVIVTGQVRVWHLFAFTFFTGVGWAFNMPVRQSVVPNLIPKEDLMNALALNSAGFNVTRILGPTLAGVLIAKVGAGENFYLQSAAYLGVALTVLRLNIPNIPRSTDLSVRDSLKEGASFIWKHPTMRTQMTLALVPVVIALPYISLMPIFATDVLHVGPGGFGMLMSAPGLGAVIGTLTVASINIERKGVVLFSSVFALGVSMVFFSLSRSFHLSLLLLVLVGAVQMAYMTTNQTLIQLAVPDELRGRVMGIYMLNQGLLPFGSLLAGTLADIFGAPAAVSLMGLMVALLALVFATQARNLRGL